MRRQIPLVSRRGCLFCLIGMGAGLGFDGPLAPQKTVNPTVKSSADLARDIAELSHADKDRRANAAVRLGRRGAKAATAVPKLAQITQSDPSSEVRGYAASALGAIGPSAKLGVDALVKATNDVDSAVARRAIVAIGEIGPNAAAALPVLRRKLSDPDPNMRRIAARALGGLAESAEPATDELISRMFNDDDAVVCREAAHALGEIGRPVGRVVGALTEVISDENAALSTRFAAVRAIGVMGPKAKSAADVLRKVVDDDDTNLATAAKVALKAVSVGGK